MEYASVVWDPHLAKDIQSLEQAQKFALRISYREWTCQYEHLLERAKLPTLSERRKRAKLCHLFKIVHELTDCQVAPVHTKMLSYNTRQVSNLSLQDLRANTSQFLFSFYPHTISLWNSLPPDIQTISSLHAFKQSLTSE